MPKAVAIVYDADAQLFFDAETAAGVTLTTTQTDAVNQLVIDLKAASIWTKMKAIYPIVGGTATAHKFNLKNPLDTNAAFRLVFFGGVTHSSSGFFGNGTNAYADTFLIPGTNFSTPYDMHLSANIITDWANTSEPQNHIGILYGVNCNYRIAATNFNGERSYMARMSSGDEIIVSTTAATHKGFWCGSRTANNVNNFIQPNGTITSNSNLISGAVLTPYSTINLMRVDGNQYFSAFGYSFFSIGNGLTTTEMTNFKTAVNNFQTALGRI